MIYWHLILVKICLIISISLFNVNRPCRHGMTVLSSCHDGCHGGLMSILRTFALVLDFCPCFGLFCKLWTNRQVNSLDYGQNIRQADFGRDCGPRFGKNFGLFFIFPTLVDVSDFYPYLGLMNFVQYFRLWLLLWTNKLWSIAWTFVFILDFCPCFGLLSMLQTNGLWLIPETFFHTSNFFPCFGLMDFGQYFLLLPIHETLASTWDWGLLSMVHVSDFFLYLRLFFHNSDFFPCFTFFPAPD